MCSCQAPRRSETFSVLTDNERKLGKDAAGPGASCSRRDSTVNLTPIPSQPSALILVLMFLLFSALSWVVIHFSTSGKPNAGVSGVPSFFQASPIWDLKELDSKLCRGAFLRTREEKVDRAGPLLLFWGSMSTLETVTAAACPRVDRSSRQLQVPFTYLWY
jgi:hypothetical protein